MLLGGRGCPLSSRFYLKSLLGFVFINEPVAQVFHVGQIIHAPTVSQLTSIQNTDRTFTSGRPK